MEFSKDELKLPEEQFGSVTKEEHSSQLAIILGLLIIFLMLILGGLYVWGEYLQEDSIPTQPAPLSDTRPTDEENNEPESTTAEAEVETMSALSTSDEFSALEADLASTDIDNLDAEKTAIEAELTATGVLPQQAQ